MNPTEQTVSVRLTAAGQKAAQGGTLSVHGSGREVSFTGDAAAVVLLSDWNQVLRSTAPYGEHFFEIAPVAGSTFAPALVPTKPSVPASKPALVTAPSAGEAK